MDEFILFLTYLLGLIVVVSITISAYRAGRKDGWEEGFNHGVTAERLRWHEAEIRAEHEMIRRAMNAGDEFQEEELDV